MLHKKSKIHFYRQNDAMDCGPTCLQILSAYYGKRINLNYIRKACYITNQGVNLSGIEHAAKQLGFKTLLAQVKFTVLQENVSLPCILHWQGNHFVVLYKIDERYCYLADPAMGKVKYSHADFLEKWRNSTLAENTGYVLLLETTNAFHALSLPSENGVRLRKIWLYLKQYPKTLSAALFTLLLSSAALLALPFLTQAVVDRGIQGNNLDLVKLLALAQCALILGRLVMDTTRARLLFHLGSRLNLQLLNNFLSKLMRLPLHFFESRHIGDNVQRLMDHQKIEEFVTKSLINLVLSSISILVFGAVLFYYNPYLFLIFLVGSGLALCWTLSWGAKRKQLDYEIFKKASTNQNMLIETITAVQEIKLTGYQEEKVARWLNQQESVYQSKLRSLVLDQKILSGSQIFNEVKNLLITCFAATLVIKQEMTMGMMLSATYIAGQLNAPILQLAEFIRTAQNARFSLQRMHEVELEEEEDHAIEKDLSSPPPAASIYIEKVSFHYGSPLSGYSLKNLSLHIPAGKTTAIVGMSGSGKTTLIKLLLKCYRPQMGHIWIDDTALSSLHAETWRNQCGAVMQNGYLFSDTIANNIRTSLPLDKAKLDHASQMANIASFITGLPLGYETKIGQDGHGLSEGQKQRLLIARLIYRQPPFIFMDEATNALDAHNEKAIIYNLQEFFRGKTVLIVAHRLSTVKNADQLVVMDQGEIVETGTHHELVAAQGAYFHLIKNQLELGK